LRVGNELAETVGRSVSEFSFAFATGERAGFRSIKSDKAIYLPIGANCITINGRD